VQLLWALLGLALLIVGLALFGALAGEGTVAIGALSLIAVPVLLILHELLHGAAMKPFGARPRYSAGLLGKALPYLSCGAPGHRFTRGQYLVVALAPAVVLSAAGAAAVPLAEWLVFPLAVHLAGCVGDFWMSGRALHTPPGARIEDTGTGMRVHVTSAAPGPR
jgi:Putative zincin peptidase